jgi:hypothetical protein
MSQIKKSNHGTEESPDPDGRGWLKLWRKIEDCCFRDKPDYFSVWVHLLNGANHTDAFVIVNGLKMLIKSGTFITSRLKISVKTGVEQHKVDRILNFFKSEQQIEQRNLTTCRLISITNWPTYQNNEQQNEQQVSSEWAASEQLVSTSKNDKNVKNEKNKESLAQKTSKRRSRDVPLIDPGFQEFWNLYPRKVGKGKAEEAWLAIGISNGTLGAIIKALSWQVKSEQWKEGRGRFIPHPTTYLIQRRWEDEPVIINTVSTKSIEELFKPKEKNTHDANGTPDL